ncbi:hypothetical protein L207DRAFT_587221 [Hyaloscypha variabilis F]|uniref:Uncharacterized protein n=1 Tax=Hyaloscypha variabilis (strain UAMH 11265 / GT02V1 / F) TaxID=1149755 RepID=A0A2J6RCF8_HYAVF|nr:hypothetical protein L207DRAFT_587221 [Hyaloscypha variabilis F]
MHLLTSSAKLHAFLTHRYDDRPHFITPTTPADLERLTSLAKALEAESSQFCNHAQSGLASTLHLPTCQQQLYQAYPFILSLLIAIPSAVTHILVVNKENVVNHIL